MPRFMPIALGMKGRVGRRPVHVSCGLLQLVVGVS